MNAERTISRIPQELWREIFDYAVNHDEEVLEPIILSGSMSNCTWYNLALGGWWLRTFDRSMHVKMRSNYVTKKAIASTCRSWNALGTELLFRYIFIDSSRILQLQTVCEVLDRNSKLAWWTRKIHVYLDRPQKINNMSLFRDQLNSLLHLCTNLSVFMIDPPLGSIFGDVAQTLCTYASNSLRSVRWNVPHEAQTKVILALDSLQSLESLELQIYSPARDQESSASGRSWEFTLDLPRLREISLHGHIQDLVEQLEGWNMPEIQSLAIGFGAICYNIPDIVQSLQAHGEKLKYLDLNCLPTLDISNILSVCPNLISFCFNIDWVLTGSITSSPHLNIENVGLHGGKYAFGVGPGASVTARNYVHVSMVCRLNDANFAMLTKAAFPALKRVRILSTGVLTELNRADGPAMGIGFKRWERWWEQCASQRVRLEDCTGHLLGTLPPVDWEGGIWDEEENDGGGEVGDEGEGDDNYSSDD